MFLVTVKTDIKDGISSVFAWREEETGDSVEGRLYAYAVWCCLMQYISSLNTILILSSPPHMSLHLFDSITSLSPVPPGANPVLFDLISSLK